MPTQKSTRGRRSRTSIGHPFCIMMSLLLPRSSSLHVKGWTTRCVHSSRKISRGFHTRSSSSAFLLNRLEGWSKRRRPWPITQLGATLSPTNEDQECNQTGVFLSTQMGSKSPDIQQSQNKSSGLKSEISLNDNIEKWKEHSDLNPSLSFPTWAVPLENASIIQTILSSDLCQPFLATRDRTIQACHPRPKIVQDGIENDMKQTTHKYILLHPSEADSELPSELKDLLQGHDVNLQGPHITIHFSYNQFPVSYILEKLLPEEVHPPPTAFETVGHIAHLNLRQHHLPYAKLIGSVLLESLPTIDTVIHKLGQVSGPYRTYDYEILAGRNDTMVDLMEHGVRLQFDLAKVYWCSRLASDRQHLLDQEIKEEQVIADAFCGVGAICLRAAKTKGCTIMANDWNPIAVDSLRHNFALNKLEQHLSHVSNQDAYDFLMDLGGFQDGDSVESENSETRTIQPVDHVLMNFPLKAPTFLGALRWWTSHNLRENNPRLHVYTFARADEETERSAEDVAIDTIASELLPAMGPNDVCRRKELDEDYGCQVIAREVRDVAPGKLVFCVSFTATSKLLRYMQGDFH